MRAQRPADAATAESLPLDDDSVADLIPWQRDYFGEAVAIEQPRFGLIEEVAAGLGGKVRVERIPTPADCTARRRHRR
jgi:hypothetical protein